MEQSVMPLADVAATLEQWAVFADSQVRSAPVPELLGHLSRMRRFGCMARSVRHAMRPDTAAAAAPTVITKRAVKAMAKPALSALAFWRLHGEAVERIAAEYGLSWKVTAPFGRTELASLAAGLRLCTTERGTKLKWPRDNSIPAAQYWPGGVLPIGVTVVADYARAVSAIPHDEAWHLSRGYVLHNGMCQRRMNSPHKWRLEIPHFVALGVRC